jgi:gamma-butyrobetaine dioxygenase
MIWKGGHMSTMMSPVSRLAELFDSAGAGAYPGEPVTVAQHLLQAAALAEAAAAPPALVGGAPLHNIGNLRGADPAADEAELSGRDLMSGADNDHGDRGAAWLRRRSTPCPSRAAR